MDIVQDCRDFRKFFFNNFEAFDLIEGISTNGKNYDFVLHKIWVDSCSSYVKSSICDVIYNQKNKNPDQVYRNVRNHLIANLDRLVPFLEEIFESAQQVIRNKIFKKDGYT